MSLGKDERSDVPAVPHTDKPKMVAAGILLLIPIVALMWIPSYAKSDPELFGFPFFFWYQFLWVFLCSSMTWCAYLLTIAARREKPREPDEDAR
jgi:hypothetical protein